jgi:predicted RNase H-like HicB family nuclease
MKTIKVTAELIPEEEGGFTVYCPELDIYTQGETEEECLANLREAAPLHLEELGKKVALRQVIRREIELTAVPFFWALPVP